MCFIGKIFNKLRKIKGVLLSDHRLACPCFDIFSGISCNCSTLISHLFILF